MKIVGRGTDDVTMTPYSFEMEGPAVGINDPEQEVIIEVQDLTHTVHIHATFAELKRVYEFCKKEKGGANER